jgi:hypothetical protein
MRVAIPLPVGALQWAGVSHVKAEVQKLAQAKLDNLPARLPGIQAVLSGLKASVRAGDWRVMGKALELDMTLLITVKVDGKQQPFALLEVTAAVQPAPKLAVFQPPKYLGELQWQLKVESRGDPVRQYLLAKLPRTLDNVRGDPQWAADSVSALL